MSKQTFTPGPWHIGMRPGPIVYGSLGEQIADCRFGLDVSDEQRQNARLIAAAPDLLAACEWVLRAIQWSVAEDRMSQDEQAALLRAAIAKATGEA